MHRAEACGAPTMRARPGRRCSTAAEARQSARSPIAPSEPEHHLCRRRPARTALRRPVRPRRLQSQRRRQDLDRPRPSRHALHRPHLGQPDRPESRSSSLPSGQFFGASDARGIYRSTDGGRTWTHPLAPGGFTGVNDIAADPQNPRTLFASTWDARQWPWQSYFTEISGPGSGDLALGRQRRALASADRWRLADRTAWPDQPGGRRQAASACASMRSSIRRRTAVCGARTTAARTGSGSIPRRPYPSYYFNRVTVDPRNPDMVYLIGQSMRRCDQRRRPVRDLPRKPRRRRLSLDLDRPQESRAHGRRLRPGRCDFCQRQQDLEQLVQPADRPILSPRGGQSLSLLGLLRAAGQRHRRDRQPQRLWRAQHARLASGRRRRARLRHSRSGRSE